jgi:hypothetical protein
MHNPGSFNLFKSLFRLTLLASLMLVSSLPALAQSAGYDLFQTGSGTSVTIPNIGTVNLQGVPIQGTTGNTDTIIHRTQNVPSGGGKVNVNVYALFMKSTASVNYKGSSADVYVTINDSAGTISTSVLPQPDSLTASTGTINVSTGGTFDSNITVNADLIFVKAGTSVTNSANYLGHQAASSTTLTSTNSAWSSTAPAGYPSSSSFPSGGFYPTSVGGGGHSTPSHVHAIVPASCGSGSTGLTKGTSNEFQQRVNCIAVSPLL